MAACFRRAGGCVVFCFKRIPRFCWDTRDGFDLVREPAARQTFAALDGAEHARFARLETRGGFVDREPECFAPFSELLPWIGDHGCIPNKCRESTQVEVAQC